jgi:hypothetical protein
MIRDCKIYLLNSSLVRKMDRYTVYKGYFICHTCKQNVASLRHYPETQHISWMCNQKHLSEVSLQTKKSKRDYDRAK